MMTVHSLTQVLADSSTLLELAAEADLSSAQVRKLLALLADVPIRQAVRMCTTARQDRVRQINRKSRTR